MSDISSARLKRFKGRKKNSVSDLARETFVAFQDYINLKRPGQLLPVWTGTGVKDKPLPLITKQHWCLLDRWKKGERGLTYKSGHEFHPRDIFSNIYSERHVQKQL